MNFCCFIPSKNAVSKFCEELKKDRAKTQVEGFTKLNLVELTRKMFNLSDKREDTFIGGLSMGGYGALRNGLKYNETFGYIISLSGALVVEEMATRKGEADWFAQGKDYAEYCMGPLDKLLESDKNPKYIVKNLIKAGADIITFFAPKLIASCLFGKNKSITYPLRIASVPPTSSTWNAPI